MILSASLIGLDVLDVRLFFDDARGFFLKAAAKTFFGLLEAAAKDIEMGALGCAELTLVAEGSGDFSAFEVAALGWGVAAAESTLGFSRSDEDSSLSDWGGVGC